MKLYDISQEVFNCAVFPGDKAPKKHEDMRMSEGSLYNLTSFEMCAHNGTHIDAPFHFIKDGDTVEQIPLEKMVGYCYVSEVKGDIGTEEAQNILEAAKQAAAGKQAGWDCEKRLLLKGDCTVTANAARVFAKEGIHLLGVEGQTVGPVNAPMEVHLILLGAKTVLLEGLRLGKIEEGAYLLNAAPISLGGSDGAPCRAILIEE